MNREIKFRAWDGERLIYPIDNIESGDIIKRYETVMQYTGLKDKNGKEIYEGDILINHSLNQSGKVEYTNGSFCHHLFEFSKDINGNYYSLYDRLPDCEIIGNIYQNPELLN